MQRTLILAILSPLLGAVIPLGTAEAAERPRCHGQVATIVGTDGSDDIVGTPGRDVIVGSRGDDVIDGRGGADVICGQGGGDELRGGRGDDVLDGGRDRLTWDKYGKGLHGDLLVPGPGDDTLLPGSDRREREYGPSSDTVDFGGRRGVVLELGDPGRWGKATGEGRDRILGQSTIGIIGTDHDDVIIGAASDDHLDGGDGDDRLVGGAGDDRLADSAYSPMHDYPGDTDRLDGGEGEDHLESFSGADQLIGGDDDDSLTSAPGHCAAHDGGGGQDTLILEGRNATLSHDGGASSVGGEAVCGSTVSTESASLSNVGNVSYRGTDGPDDVVVWAATVTASMLGGDDTIRTGSGDDVIDAGAGIDTVDAHDGVDVCDNAETAHNCESGANLPVPRCDGRTATIVVTRPSSPWPPAEPVAGTPGDDVILGSEYDDVIDGGAGNDVICGGGGADTLTGGDGDDRLFGGLDAHRRIDNSEWMRGDTLAPGPGNDYLDAGWDSDQLIHPWGSFFDTLDFSSSHGAIAADLVTGTVTGQGSDVVRSVPRQRLVATAYDDRITTGSSDDQIFAGDGVDVVDAGAGDDQVDTARGADTVVTGDGNDRVNAHEGAGMVRIATGSGDDLVAAHSGAVLDGGAGVDRIDFTDESLRGTVTMDVRAGTLRDHGDLDLVLSGWEDYSFRSSKVPWRFTGSGRDESFVVRGARRVTALGRGGDDVLKGTSGRDRLAGGAGHDRAFGFQGRDLCLAVERARGCERNR